MLSADPTWKFTRQINVKQLRAFCFGWLAWWVWPDSSGFWGLYVLSVLLAWAALRALIEALAAMQRLYLLRKEIAVMSGEAVLPKSAVLVDRKMLRRMGMIE